MNETKNNSSLITKLVFVNSLVIIGILAFFGYKFSQNEYPQDYYPPSNEMIEMCRVSSFCFIDENSEFIDLMSALVGKSKTSRYDFTLIVSSIPEPVKDEIDDTSASSTPFENWQVHEPAIQRKYETLGDYCRDADLCLTKKNVSLDEMVDAVIMWFR